MSSGEQVERPNLKRNAAILTFDSKLLPEEYKALQQANAQDFIDSFAVPAHLASIVKEEPQHYLDN
ncbi:hypothetical protein FD17_GL001724 [Lentilactobacillus sunkii DSM 19904]|uniref:Uncharacterized protein n=1 Tax=Lentilactobacillus sunkii DSM 19904 TaxID=1423808 RepID=A0A0R1L0J7_9LACO|nr:hypothetical protein FD17_GL001724 [Lentilactobacillus sunkii DSM 19904]